MVHYIDPHLSGSHFNYALVLSERADELLSEGNVTLSESYRAQAISHYETAYTINNHFDDPLFNLGIMYLESGDRSDTEKKQEDYRKALSYLEKISPDYPEYDNVNDMIEHIQRTV